MKKTVSINKANLLGLLFLPIAALFLILFYYFWGFPDLTSYIDDPLSLSISMLVIMLATVVHELIHGLCFLLFAKEGFKSVKIGFMWKKLTPYAHCKEPLSKFHYRVAVLMPGLVLGIIPIIVGLLLGYFFLFVFGLFLTLGAVGDLIVFILTFGISTNKKLLDHTTECGFIVVD